MCCDSDDKTIDSPIVKAAVYTAWGLPFLGLAVHGIWGAIGAAAVMISTPVVVFAVAMQRYLVRGLTMGSVKG